MNLSQQELELMVQHLTQEVARLTADKAMLLAKLELTMQKGQE